MHAYVEYLGIYDMFRKSSKLHILAYSDTCTNIDTFYFLVFSLIGKYEYILMNR